MCIRDRHYCLCAVVSTPDNPVEIPQSFRNNVILDKWVQDNPNVALLNVYPMNMSVSQMDQAIFFGNSDSVSRDFEFILQFYCDFDAGERWSSNSRVRIQCTDSNYLYDKSNLIIQSYQEGDKYQSIRLDMNNVPPNFAGMFMVYVDNIDPAPAHGVIDCSYAIKIKESDIESLDAVSRKERLLPQKTGTGEVIYLLEIGSCYAYNKDMSEKEFQSLRSRVNEYKTKQRWEACLLYTSDAADE